MAGIHDHVLAVFLRRTYLGNVVELLQLFRQIGDLASLFRLREQNDRAQLLALGLIQRLNGTAHLIEIGQTFVVKIQRRVNFLRKLAF
ncbi:hypothetical protein SDC9_165748 [bioreactor metagenome]|uniref:Uncharacterized protein n=1 Tax=bioreactor metagenome TaxID=1076179 RepID=A0A645FV31_9ZZZZ